jgi:hypothetical protein
MSAIEWFKRHANLARSASSWGVLVTVAWGGEPRYGFWYDIPSQQGKGPASFPPRTRAETIEIARYVAAKDSTLPERYSVAVAFYRPVNRALAGHWTFTSAQIRAV